MELDRVVSGSHTILNKVNSMKATSGEQSLGSESILAQDQQMQNEKAINKDELNNVLTKMNDFLEPVRRNVKFELHEKLEKYYVTVIDSNTKEVIKEIPPKKMLDMYAEMADFMGLLIDKQI